MVNNRFHELKTRNRNISIAEYESGATILKSFPRAVYVELTQNCNLRCFMCKPEDRIPRGYKKEWDMSSDLFDHICEELFPYAEIVGLNGWGESTMLKGFETALDTTIEFGCRVQMVTNLNGTPSVVLDKLVASDAMLSVSIDAPSAKTYEEIRSGGNFANLLEKMHELKSLRERYGTCKDLCVHMILYRSNLDQLERMVELVSDFEVARLLVWPMDLGHSEGDRIIYHLEAGNEAIVSAFERASEVGIELRVCEWLTRPIGATKLLKYTACICPTMYFSVTYDGQVGYCDCNSTPGSLSKFNLKDHSFAEIWNSEVYQRIRKAMRQGVDQVAKVETSCSKCMLRRFVDFEDSLYPPHGSRVVNNLSPCLDL